MLCSVCCSKEEIDDMSVLRIDAEEVNPVSE